MLIYINYICYYNFIIYNKRVLSMLQRFKRRSKGIKKIPLSTSWTAVDFVVLFGT